MMLATRVVVLYRTMSSPDFIIREVQYLLKIPSAQSERRYSFFSNFFRNLPTLFSARSTRLDMPVPAAFAGLGACEPASASVGR